ncbi:MAG: VWA domain-containing protein [Blastocatellales bacterium]
MITLRLGGYLTIAVIIIAIGSGMTFHPDYAQSQNKDRSSNNQRQQDPGTLRIETELVQIDVVVSDKQGKLVKDLKREDFQLTEDGNPQSISHFSIGTANRQAKWLITDRRSTGKDSRTATQQQSLDVGRYLVLAVDDLHLSPGNLMQAKKSLNKFLDQQLATSDQVAMITTSGSLGMYQQFTTDREALRRAINRLPVSERKVTTDFDVPRITPYQAELIDMGDPDALELAVQELMRELQMDRRMATSQAQGKARMINQQNTSITVSTLYTLENVIRGLRDLPGRKIIVLLSDGFLLGGFSNGRHFDVRRITDAATRAGVVIYSLDARGLIAMPSSLDASHRGFVDLGPLGGARMRIENSSIEAERDGMYALAADTGGTAFFNNNDLGVGLQKILDDTETYYLLAFEPAVSYRDGRFRKIEIRIPSRPDLKVRTRKGYFAPDDKAAEKEARETARAEEKDKQKSPEKLAKETRSAKEALLREGVSSLYPLRGIPVEMTVNFINTPTDGSTADIIAHIDAARLSFKSVGDRFQAVLDVAGLLFDENGKMIDNFSNSLDMNLKKSSYENTMKTGLIFQKYLKLKPGYYQVRIVALQNGSKEIGSASHWIEIPDLEKNGLTLSSVFFPAEEGLNQIQDTASREDGPTVKPDDSRPKQIYRRFKRNGSFDFMIFAYNAKLDEKGEMDLAIQTQVYSGNKLILATPLKSFLGSIEASNSTGNRKPDKPAGQIDVQRLPYLARLRLDAFEPGEYELRLVVIDRNAKSSAKRAVNFTVE